MAIATPVQRPRGPARREAMLRAVLTIVGDTGPDAVTHRRVAEVAGLPLASTTYWFSSKEELLAAALELAADADVARLKQAATEPGHEEDLIDAVVAVILDPVSEGLRSSRASLIAACALWLEAARRPALRKLATRWPDAYHKAVADLLERDGIGDAPQIARLLVAAADGLVMDQLARGGACDLHPRLRELAVALVDRDRRRS